jgi:hypothetical protein
LHFRFKRIIFGLKLRFVNRIFGLQSCLFHNLLRGERGAFDFDLRPQLCNLRFRLQQLFAQRPLPLHALQRKRLRLRIRHQQLHLQLSHIAPATLPIPLPHRCCRRLLLLRQLLRVATSRLLLDHRPHALVGHGGGEIAESALLAASAWCLERLLCFGRWVEGTG